MMPPVLWVLEDSSDLEMDAGAFMDLVQDIWGPWRLAGGGGLVTGIWE